MAAEIVENGVDSAEQEEGQKEIKVEAYYLLANEIFLSFYYFIVLENFIILFLGGTNCG